MYRGIIGWGRGGNKISQMPADGLFLRQLVVCYQTLIKVSKRTMFGCVFFLVYADLIWIQYIVSQFHLRR